jgi:hypothetical protein
MQPYSTVISLPGTGEDGDYLLLFVKSPEIVGMFVKSPLCAIGAIIDK